MCSGVTSLSTQNKGGRTTHTNVDCLGVLFSYVVRGSFCMGVLDRIAKLWKSLFDSLSVVEKFESQL